MYVCVCVCVCVCVFVCVCVSLSANSGKNNPLHLQWRGRRGQAKRVLYECETLSAFWLEEHV